VGVALTLVAGGALIWLAARLSMVLPMSFDQGRIRIREAWDLTRGHAKELLLLAVLLVVLGVAIAAVLFAILTAAVGAFVASYAGAQGMATFMTEPTKDVIRELTPWGLAAAALSAIVSTFGLVIFTAPWAEAYRQIMGGAEHAEEVF
jgi:membrane-anchored glycerophosphoryl diester phosphodiesterase (GDPDase)